ncbi:MAG: OmpA family protein [Leptospiraceae bacterium]|nr:OmpA family protein [Leptospiraceae bacterium]
MIELLPSSLPELSGRSASNQPEESISESSDSTQPSDKILNTIFIITIIIGIISLLLVLGPCKQEVRSTSQTLENNSSKLYGIEDITSLKLKFKKQASELSPESKSMIKKIAESLSVNKDWKLKIIGHSSTEGEEETNQSVALDRANAVKSYLISQGIKSDRISTEAKGEKEPIAPEATEEDREKNRRVEFRIAK